MTEICKKGRGGSRAGAGRRPLCPGGTVWARLPIPRGTAYIIGAEPGNLRAALLAMLRAARPDLPW